MRKRARIALLLATTCGGFVLGAAVGGLATRKNEISHGPPAGRSGDRLVGPGEVRSLLGTRENLRKDLASKEGRIRELETELSALREKPSGPLTPGQEQWRKTIRQWERGQKLQSKILQWRDKAAHRAGLEEFAALLRSEDVEDVLLGWGLVEHIWQYVEDMGQFRPQFLRAMSHEDDRVRFAALQHARFFCSGDEFRDMMFSLAKDPSPMIRRDVCRWLVFQTREGAERREEATSLFTKLLEDEDAHVKDSARWAFLSWGPETQGEDMLMEMSRDANSAGAVQRLAWHRRTISGRLAERLAELYDEQAPLDRSLQWTRGKLADEAKPIASRLWVRALREGIEPSERREALEVLGRIGAPPVIPDLEAIAKSDDAEGIEEELARTIERLQKQTSGGVQ